MKKILNTIKDRFNEGYNGVIKWKHSNNKKVIGCLPMYFPEEFVHAAGMLPIILFGSDEPITLANKHLMTNSCGLVRSTFDSLLKGKYGFLDGIAALLVCDQVRFFFEVWQLDHRFSFFHQFWRPYNINNNSRIFLINELKRLKSALEEYSGTEITPTAIKSSVNIYNETRKLMRRLYDIRKKNPGLISASDMIELISASMFMLKDEYNKLLGELLSKAEEQKDLANHKLKFIIAGHPCAIPDGRILEIVENFGAVIVDDDFYCGHRYFDETDISLGKDPIEAYADYYMKKMPCTTYCYHDHWLDIGATYSVYGDLIIDMAKKNQANGVILLREMYCDPFDLEFIMIKKKLEVSHIPYISIPVEHGMGSLEAVKTRVQAFIEMNIS